MLSHLCMLSESRRLIDTHFLPSLYHFLAPRTQGNAQSTPSTICCSLWHTTTITWSLPVLENQVHSGKSTWNLSHCAICLWLLCWATSLWHADCVESLLYYSQPMCYYVEPFALCWTTCASYATCHLTKHTPLVLFPTRDLLSLFSLASVAKKLLHSWIGAHTRNHMHFLHRVGMHLQVLLYTMHVQVCMLDRCCEHQRTYLLHALYSMCICDRCRYILYIYMCIGICIYIYVYVHVCAYVYVYVSMYVCMYVCVCICIHIYV